MFGVEVSSVTRHSTVDDVDNATFASRLWCKYRQFPSISDQLPWNQKTKRNRVRNAYRNYRGMGRRGKVILRRKLKIMVLLLDKIEIFYLPVWQTFIYINENIALVCNVIYQFNLICVRYGFSWCSCLYHQTFHSILFMFNTCIK